MWITLFSHAFRLTIAVDNPFPAPTSLDSGRDPHSFPRSGDLQVFLERLQRLRA
jgi:hypothetical protein